MGKIIPRKISYKELRDGSYRDAYVPQDEKFEGVASMTSYLRDALGACPNNNDDSKTAMYLMLDEGKAVLWLIMVWQVVCSLVFMWMVH